MGMYTELYLSVRFKSNLPRNVAETLLFLFGGGDAPEGDEFPEHPFFKCDRFSMIGSCSSYYFIPFPVSVLEFDNISNCYYLTTRSDFKNYGGEIRNFLDWVRPYLDMERGEHIGHTRYEEDTGPTILYMCN